MIQATKLASHFNHLGPAKLNNQYKEGPHNRARGQFNTIIRLINVAIRLFMKICKQKRVRLLIET